VLRQLILAASRSPAVARTVAGSRATRGIVDRFVAGQTVDDAVRVARLLAADGLSTSLDHLGEDVHDPAQARAAADACVMLVERLAAAGLTGRAEVSVKLSSLGQALDPALALEQAGRVCAAAAAAGTTVTVDMEDHTTTDGTLAAVAELRREWPWVGAVVQAQLRRSEADCRELATAGSRVRLCKGAYRAPGDEGFLQRRSVGLMHATRPLVRSADARRSRQTDHRQPPARQVELLRAKVPFPQSVVRAFGRESEPFFVSLE